MHIFEKFYDKKCWATDYKIPWWPTASWGPSRQWICEQSASYVPFPKLKKTI